MLNEVLVNGVKKFFAKKWLSNFPHRIDPSFVTPELLSEKKQDIDSLILLLIDADSEEEIRAILEQSSHTDLACLLVRIEQAVKILEDMKDTLVVTIDLLHPYNLQTFLKILLIDSFS